MKYEIQATIKTLRKMWTRIMTVDGIRKKFK